MADENNLTTLAKRLRPLLGDFVQGLVKSVIGEGPGIDLVVSGNITNVGLGGDSFLLYDDGGNPVAEFATLSLALASASSGQVVITPAGTFTENVTVPPGVGVRSIGNNTILAGIISLGGNNSFLKSVTLALTVNSAGDIAGIIGPPSGEAILNDCTIVVTNNGAGNAYSVQVGAGDILILKCNCKAYANGGGDALAIYGASETIGICNSDGTIIWALAVGGGVGHGVATDGSADYKIKGGEIIATTTPIRM
jgi:hypothetical protein